MDQMNTTDKTMDHQKMTDQMIEPLLSTPHNHDASVYSVTLFGATFMTARINATHDVRRPINATHDVRRPINATHDVRRQINATHDVRRQINATHDVRRQDRL